MLSARRRAVVAIAVGLGSMVLALLFRFVFHQQSSDFDQIVVGARRVLSGQSPYTIAPLPGLEWPIYYPMPALVLGFPFAALPLPWAQGLFCGISGACFGWAMSSEGDAKLFALGTWPYILSVSLGQWGPLLMATTALPALGWITLAKPNLGVAFGAGYGMRWISRPSLWFNAFMVCALLTVSFAVRPPWVREWLAVLATPTPHLIAPVTVVGGVALLIALVRWRRSEARTLAALSLVPQTFSSYDSLIVFIVPQTRRQALVLVAATTLVTAIVGFIGPATTYAETVRRFAPLRIALVYVPALVMVLMRPNVAQESNA